MAIITEMTCRLRLSSDLTNSVKKLRLKNEETICASTVQTPVGTLHHTTSQFFTWSSGTYQETLAAKLVGEKNYRDAVNWLVRETKSSDAWERS